MRCKACNKKLSDAELMRKVTDPITKKSVFLDMCGRCYDASKQVDSYTNRSGSIHVDVTRTRL